METWQNWRRGGRLITVELPGASYQIFVRVRGTGPAVTLIHGFPTSSFDWARLEPLLTTEHTVISIDLLGYGGSDQPARHRYSVAEHADIIQAAWRQLGVGSTLLVGHDVGSAVARELLARERAERGVTPLFGVVLLNGSLVPDCYTPALVTRLLARPPVGWLLARSMTERRYVAAMAGLFAPAGRPPLAELHDYWTILTIGSGTARLPRLVHYLADGQENKTRWLTALLQSPVPVQVVWGADDSAIPRAVVDDVRRLLPDAPVTVLDGVGHFPQIERPDVVAEAIRALSRELYR